jgi:hypothetical protein
MKPDVAPFSSATWVFQCQQVMNQHIQDPNNQNMMDFPQNNRMNQHDPSGFNGHPTSIASHQHPG